MARGAPTYGFSLILVVVGLIVLLVGEAIHGGEMLVIGGGVVVLVGVGVITAAIASTPRPDGGGGH
ncbi:MAG: hypothetical protein ACQETI_12215 [Halobacteriota archaeon]